MDQLNAKHNTQSPFLKVLLLFSLLFFSGLSNAEVDNQYRLGAGDKIKILVHGENDLTVTTTLPDTGILNYPFLGEVRAADLSVDQLTKKITDGLKPDYLVNPAVNIDIIEYRGFFIRGEVKRPGSYPYQPGLTVEKAVALAGGFTDRAAKNKIFVVTEKEKEEQERKIELEELIQAGDILNIKQRFF